MIFDKKLDEGRNKQDQKVTPSKPCHTFLPLYVIAVAWPRSTFRTGNAMASCSISPGYT